MSRRLVITALVCLFAVPALASSGAGLSFTLRLIRTLSLRVDSLQARIDGADVPSSAVASIDTAERSGPQQAFVAGWAFACERLPGSDVQDTSRPVVVVDSIELDLRPTTRPARPDVVLTWQNELQHCVAFGGGYVPLESGVEFSVNLAPFGAGRHRIQIRTYDLFGRAYTTDGLFVDVLP